MADIAGRVVIYGGRGALGTKCVHAFNALNWWVCSMDHTANSEADVNIIIDKDESTAAQEQDVIKSLSSILDGTKVDAIICVAGGWIGGNASCDLVSTTQLMWHKNIGSSLICAVIANKCLKKGGLLVFSGAKAAMNPTPSMIGYGITKAAVHQLTISLSSPNSGLPDDAIVIALLPITLDTTENRKYMPDADLGSWTPLQFVVDLLLRWVSGKDLPISGSLCELVTNNFNTDVIFV